MTRLEKIKRLMIKPNKDINRVALSFMETDTLHFLVSLRKDNKGSISANELPEPYRTDVVNSFEKAKKKLSIKY